MVGSFQQNGDYMQTKVVSNTSENLGTSLRYLYDTGTFQGRLFCRSPEPFATDLTNGRNLFQDRQSLRCRGYSRFGTCPGCVSLVAFVYLDFIGSDQQGKLMSTGFPSRLTFYDDERWGHMSSFCCPQISQDVVGSDRDNGFTSSNFISSHFV